MDGRKPNTVVEKVPRRGHVTALVAVTLAWTDAPLGLRRRRRRDEKLETRPKGVRLRTPVTVTSPETMETFADDGLAFATSFKTKGRVGAVQAAPGRRPDAVGLARP